MPGLTSQQASDEVAGWFMRKMFMKSPDRLLPFPAGCNRFWLPMTDIEQDGVWVDDNSGQKVEFFDWKKGEPNGGTTQNCGNIVPPRGWTDRPCHVGKGRLTMKCNEWTFPFQGTFLLFYRHGIG